MRVLYLGSYGFGNLGDELCLAEAVRTFSGDEVWTYAHDPRLTARATGVTNFIASRKDIAMLRPHAVVIGGGGIGFLPAIRDFLAWAVDATKLGARLFIHNIGVYEETALDRTWLAPEILQAIRDAEDFTVRDAESARIATQWCGRQPAVTGYPEVIFDSDPTLLGLLPDAPLLGISLANRDEVKQTLMGNRQAVDEMLAAFPDHVIIPIISTVHNVAAVENDILAFQWFQTNFLRGRTVGFRETLLPAWWRLHMTPKRLRGVIGKLDCLAAQRKHNCIHAIGAGVPLIGLDVEGHASIARIFEQFDGTLATGSRLLTLRIS